MQQIEVENLFNDLDFGGPVAESIKTPSVDKKYKQNLMDTVCKEHFPFISDTIIRETIFLSDI